MTTPTQPPNPSTSPTELGPRPGDGDDDGLRWSPRVELAPGVVLGDRYRIVECIGMGGMATVFRAEHVEIGKSVAIKVLGEELARKPALVERFLQEARAASAVRHPNIVEITDFGYVREGLPYYVMEYLEGESLARRLGREGRLPWSVARRITLQLCKALAATHERGVVHRDMKPDNVILVESGGDPDFVKVLDFGIAKVVSDDGDRGLTRTGVIMGTAAYMSPEQAKSQAIDARTDLYAVGVMLYEMLAGRVPFDGDGVMEVLTKHIIEPVPPLRRAAPRITGAVERVVQRALHKDRDQRYASARALAEALEALDEHGRAGGRWWRWLLVLLLVGAAAAGGAWWVQQGSWRREPAPELPAAEPSGGVDGATGEGSSGRPSSDDQGGRDGGASLPPPPDLPSDVPDVPPDMSADLQTGTSTGALPSPGTGSLPSVDELEPAPAGSTEAAAHDDEGSTPVELPKPPDPSLPDVLDDGSGGEG
ncbi:MAG: serine/threonine protein kinase [Myxococcales bacterium]|nr:serine/threonine protein kinase [Myxococcales bacterium]